MAESTVSGPFRSENGFQQLDENGEWVPVAGGGGGGVTSIIAGSGISVSSPTGAVTISATGGGGGGTTNIFMEWGDFLALPAPTAVGHIYNVDVKYAATEDPALPAVTIELPVIGNGLDSIALVTVYGVNPFLPEPVFSDVFSDFFEIIFGPNQSSGYASLRIVWAGVFGDDPETQINIFQVFVNLLDFPSP